MDIVKKNVQNIQQGKNLLSSSRSWKDKSGFLKKKEPKWPQKSQEVQNVLIFNVFAFTVLTYTMRFTGDLVRKFFESDIFFPSVFFGKSPVGAKWFWSLMRTTWGIFWQFKVDEILTKVSFCIFKILSFFKVEWGADLGRSPLVRTLLVHCNILYWILNIL